MKFTAVNVLIALMAVGVTNSALAADPPPNLVETIVILHRRSSSRSSSTQSSIGRSISSRRTLVPSVTSSIRPTSKSSQLKTSTSGRKSSTTKKTPGGSNSASKSATSKKTPGESSSGGKSSSSRSVSSRHAIVPSLTSSIRPTLTSKSIPLKTSTRGGNLSATKKAPGAPTATEKSAATKQNTTKEGTTTTKRDQAPKPEKTKGAKPHGKPKNGRLLHKRTLKNINTPNPVNGQAPPARYQDNFDAYWKASNLKSPPTLYITKPETGTAGEIFYVSSNAIGHGWPDVDFDDAERPEPRGRRALEREHPIEFHWLYTLSIWGGYEKSRMPNIPSLTVTQ
ncbi:hypothetical protein EJ08DRAFT_652975 [Tothia fuscella]|uniref:Uncharacterized protein n=1 Tax=Tothia fuscella TaxID=1048955 RepID=A0A9P4NIJ3_9PEZI|nr:hypothetical protein EJ08DRAFT_652975 [Tothia fuscella]